MCCRRPFRDNTKKNQGRMYGTDPGAADPGGARSYVVVFRRNMTLRLHRGTSSSAQGNCSAKSLAASVMSSILPFPPCLPQPGFGRGGVPPPAGGSCLQPGVGGSGGERGGSVGGGGSGRGEGAGDISVQLPYTALVTTWCFALKGLRTTRNSCVWGVRCNERRRPFSNTR